jgi:hypothetical protein
MYLGGTLASAINLANISSIRQDLSSMDAVRADVTIKGSDGVNENFTDRES